MKIAISTTGDNLQGAVDPRFGRCPAFLIVETDDMSFQVVANPNDALGHGAGIQTARLVSEAGAEVVLTGHCGPNAMHALKEAGIAVYVDASGTVEESVQRFLSGDWKPVS